MLVNKRLNLGKHAPRHRLFVTITNADQTGSAWPGEKMNNAMEYLEKILLVDDEEGLLSLLRTTLSKERYNYVEAAITGAEALRLLRENDFDLIVLDVTLPDCSGFDLCTEIRRYSRAPIIFLSARTSDFDKLTGLTVGGDDYVTKPFNAMELVARVKAIFRRRDMYREQAGRRRQEGITVFDYGGIAVYPEQGTVKVHGKEIECTAKEMALLAFFCRNPNRVFSVSHLYRAVWGEESVGDEKTVGIHISKLRKKLDDDADAPGIIINTRGFGYTFIPPTGSLA